LFAILKRELVEELGNLGRSEFAKARVNRLCRWWYS